MRRNAKKTASLILAGLMLTSSICTAIFTAGVSANGVKSPEKIERVIVDCRNAETFAKTSSVHVHTPTAAEPDPYTGGKYSFSDSMKAMEVEYNENANPGNEFRVLTKFNAKKSITEEYKYFVIVYAAKTSKDYKITVWNGGKQGPEMTVKADGKDTKAKFIVSEPVDVSGADSQGRSTLSRWMSGSHSTIFFKTTDKNARFLIKEYAFFKSPEDAKAYYAGVDLDKSPEEYGPNAVTPEAATQPAAPAPTVSLPEVEVYPVAMSFEGEKNFSKLSKFVGFTGENANLDGKYEFVTLEDGTECLKLNYYAYTGGGGGGFSDYRMFPAFKGANILTENHKYIRITYMTTDKAQNSISIKNNGTGAKVTIVPDTSVSAGKFVTSPPVDIQTEGITARYAKGIHCGFNYWATTKDSALYIKEILFFGTKAQAEAYDPEVGIELSEELQEMLNNNVVYYSTTKVEEPAEGAQTGATTVDAAPAIMSFEGMNAFYANAKFNYFSGDQTDLEGRYSFVTLDDGTQCLKLNYHVFTGTGSNYAPYRTFPSFNGTGIATNDHKYACITYMTTYNAPVAITLRNPAGQLFATLTSDASASQGRFITTYPVDISAAGLAERLATGKHCAINFNATAPDTDIYIKEIGLFTSKEQALAYYGDSINGGQSTYSVLKFGSNGNAMANTDNEMWGKSVENANTLDIIYAESTERPNIYYMAKLKARNSGIFDPENRYIRVLYSAKNPDDVMRASMYIFDTPGGTNLLVTDQIRNTNGEFVLTPPVYIIENMAKRFSHPFNSFNINAQSEGGVYSVKAIYGFKTRAEAEAFTLEEETHKLSIAGNDISKYQIVVAEDAPDRVLENVESLVVAIDELSGVKVPVVYDDAPASEYEILIGRTNRAASGILSVNTDGITGYAYSIFVNGNSLVINSELDALVPSAITIAENTLFYRGATNIPEEVNVSADFRIAEYDTTYKEPGWWQDPAPVDNPIVITEDFDVDEGYFTEDNGEKNWRYEDGAYKTDATELASSYVHVYEKNVIHKATLTYTAENGGSMGLVARSNFEYAYVRAGYDFKNGEWFIDSRTGRDFYNVRSASAKAEITPDTAYELVLTVNGDTAALSVNGVAVIDGAKLTHPAPGRLGVFAENASVSVDNVEITLVSGQGTVIKNVAYSKIPYDDYLEGGTVQKRNDGSLTYVHGYSAYNVGYRSIDGGVTWTETEEWSDNHEHGQPNIIRLNNGDFLRMIWTTDAAGKSIIAAQTSSDDGITWSEGAYVCDAYWNGTAARAVNMNDKLFQSGTNDRIFYCQTYVLTAETTTSFGCIFYSDDNGKTWTKSETDTTQIEGNDAMPRFAEIKVLECADGTIRLYCSWNFYGYIAYSDSTDGGKTFGPLQLMEDFPTPAASMQFVRDPYADNDTTYYMIWCNSSPVKPESMMSRHRLTLAKSTDGKNWTVLGDVLNYQSKYLKSGWPINHIVDPFIYVTEDRIICGTGFSEGDVLVGENGGMPHMGQRQYIFAIDKSTLS